MCAEKVTKEHRTREHLIHFRPGFDWLHATAARLQPVQTRPEMDEVLASSVFLRASKLGGHILGQTPYADLPLRTAAVGSSSENLSSFALCHTCSTRATQSASTLCSGCVLWTPAMAIISIVVGLLQRRSSRSLELETLPGRSSHDTEAVSSRKLVCSRRTTLSCEAAAENLSARTLGT